MNLNKTIDSEKNNLEDSRVNKKMKIESDQQAITRLKEELKTLEIDMDKLEQASVESELKRREL